MNPHGHGTAPPDIAPHRQPRRKDLDTRKRRAQQAKHAGQRPCVFVRAVGQAPFLASPGLRDDRMIVRTRTRKRNYHPGKRPMTHPEPGGPRAPSARGAVGQHRSMSKKKKSTAARYEFTSSVPARAIQVNLSLRARLATTGVLTGPSSLLLGRSASWRACRAWRGAS